MVLLDADRFLTALTRMYEATTAAGGVVLTMKRSTMTRIPRGKEGRARHAEKATPENTKCLLRATDGKKKISVTLTAEEHVKFQSSFNTLLRAHMARLKKKDKKKTPKKK